MAAKLVPIGDLRGGRNGSDPPLSLPDTQCVEALNVDHFDGLIARKRGGSTAISDTGGTAFSSGMQTLIRHIPGNDETAAELWGFDGATIAKRLTGGTSWANVTLDDAVSTSPQGIVGASLNGKLFLAYDSTQDRLHVYDPNLASARVRRVGIAPGTNAPTLANDAAGGAYPATKIWIRVRFTQVNGSIVVRRSEYTPAASITPSGVNVGVDITRPTLPGEGETHWETEGSTDGITYYVLRGAGGGEVNSATALSIALTVCVLTLLPTSFSTGSVSEASGTYGLVPSVKYLLTDGNRLLGAGAWESSGATSSGKNSRVWFTPVLGSTDHGDDERSPNTATQKNFVDLNENDGGFITGLGGPINGAVYVFKYRDLWRLGPTGDVTVPYIPRRISSGIFGAVSHKGICVGKDAIGNPAIYFWSPDGPCRVVVSGGASVVQYLGRDVEDITNTVNLAATGTVVHAVRFPYLHQVWFWVATSASNDPDTKLVFDELLGRFTEGERIRGGWYKHTGDSAAARCSVMFANTLGASMSRDLRPYIGRASGTAVQKCESGATDDAGTTFQAYVKTKPIQVAPLGMNVGVGQTYLLAKAASGVSIRQTIDRDFGLETRTADVLLTAAASETRVIKKFEGSDMAQAGTVQFQFGDAAAVSNGWTLDSASAPIHAEDRR